MQLLMMKFDWIKFYWLLQKKNCSVYRSIYNFLIFVVYISIIFWNYVNRYICSGIMLNPGIPVHRNKSRAWWDELLHSITPGLKSYKFKSHPWFPTYMFASTTIKCHLNVVKWSHSSKTIEMTSIEKALIRRVFIKIP